MKKKPLVQKAKKLNPFRQLTWQEKLIKQGIKGLIYLTFFLAGYLAAKLQSLYL